MYCTAIVYLVSTLAFVSVWKLGKMSRVIALVVTLIACVLSAFIPGLHSTQRFVVVLAMGSLGWILCCTVVNRRNLFSASCTLIAALVPWTPLLRCDNIAWEYCLVFSGVLLCLLMAIADQICRGERVTEQASANFVRSPILSFLPLLIIPVAFLLLFGDERIAAAKAGVLCAVLFGISALLLSLQEQIGRRKRAEKMNDAFDRWQRESRDYMNTIRSQRHDFNLHLHAISGLISSAEYNECGEYVRKLVAEASAVNDIMPVADAVVGSMLYNMREQARRCGSDITYHITYDMEDVVCNGFECNKIIGNLLQNAIDALHTPEDLACGIHAKIFKRRGYTVITVENRFVGDKDIIARVFEPGYSTKQKHDGIGLSMVLRTVEQYAGRVYPEFEDDKIRFVVNIPNRVTLKEEVAQ